MYALDIKRDGQWLECRFDTKEEAMAFLENLKRKHPHVVEDFKITKMYHNPFVGYQKEM